MAVPHITTKGTCTQNYEIFAENSVNGRVDSDDFFADFLHTRLI